MITAAAAGSSGSITIPIGMLLTVLGFSLTGLSGFFAWMVKQITIQSRFQAETSIVLRSFAERAAEDRGRMDRIEERLRFQTTKDRNTL